MREWLKLCLWIVAAMFLLNCVLMITDVVNNYGSPLEVILYRMENVIPYMIAILLCRIFLYMVDKNNNRPAT